MHLLQYMEEFIYLSTLILIFYNPYTYSGGHNDSRYLAADWSLNRRLTSFYFLSLSNLEGRSGVQVVALL